MEDIDEKIDDNEIIIEEKKNTDYQYSNSLILLFNDIQRIFNTFGVQYFVDRKTLFNLDKTGDLIDKKDNTIFLGIVIKRKDKNKARFIYDSFRYLNTKYIFESPNENTNIIFGIPLGFKDKKELIPQINIQMYEENHMTDKLVSLQDEKHYFSLDDFYDYEEEPKLYKTNQTKYKVYSAQISKNYLDRLKKLSI